MSLTLTQYLSGLIGCLLTTEAEIRGFLWFAEKKTFKKKWLLRLLAPCDLVVILEEPFPLTEDQ